jgi:hypothetical protein
MFRSLMETGTGYTSLLTDRHDIVDEEVVRKRPLRDTYQFEVVVEGLDADLDNLDQGNTQSSDTSNGSVLDGGGPGPLGE